MSSIYFQGKFIFFNTNLGSEKKNDKIRYTKEQTKQIFLRARDASFFQVTGAQEVRDAVSIVRDFSF